MSVLGGNGDRWLLMDVLLAFEQGNVYEGIRRNQLARLRVLDVERAVPAL